MTDEVIAGSTAHVYRVTATVTTDPDTATTASSDCTLATGETGTGFRNDTSLVTNGETLDADACAPFAIVTMLKDLVGTPAYDGLGGATIEYDLTVTNTGAGATTYDLTDELRFGIGATVLHASVANTSPTGHHHESAVGRPDGPDRGQWTADLGHDHACLPGHGHRDRRLRDCHDHTRPTAPWIRERPARAGSMRRACP